MFVVLLLPTDFERVGKRGRVKSEIYDLRYGRGRLQLSIDGLRRLQRALLDLLGAAYALLGAALVLVRGDVLRWFVGQLRGLGDELRSRLGL